MYSNTLSYSLYRHQDESAYADALSSVCEAVREHMKSNVRTLFNRKKDSMQDLMFYNPVSEDSRGISVKTAVPTASRDSLVPAKEVRFFLDGKGELSKPEMQAYCNQTISARALVSVPYAYTLNKNAYGVKSLLCTLDMREKPEDAMQSVDSKGGRVENSGMLDLGDAFL